jgi:hypothetical protein
LSAIRERTSLRFIAGVVLDCVRANAYAKSFAESQSKVFGSFLANDAAKVLRNIRYFGSCQFRQRIFAGMIGSGCS